MSGQPPLPSTSPSDAETRRTRSTPVHAIVVLAIGLFSISFSPILVRFAAEAPGTAVAVWRTVLAAALIVPVAVVRHLQGRLQPIRRNTVWAIVAAAAFLALHFILWIESLYHTSVASASVLVATTPIFIGVLGYVFLRERLRVVVVVAIALGVLGAVLIAGGDVGSAVNGHGTLGNLLALSASLAAAVYLMIGGIVRKGVNWLSYVAPLYALVAVVVVVTALARGVDLFGYSAGFYALCLGMAVGPQLLGHGSFNYVLRYVSPTLLSLLILLEPVVSSILAYFLFTEQPGPIALAGMVLVLISVALAVLGERRRA